MPGLPLQDGTVRRAEAVIDITAAPGTRLLRCRTRTRREATGKPRVVTERRDGARQRRLRLPAEADGGAIRAARKGGVAPVLVPRRAPLGPAGRKLATDRG